MNNFIVNGEGVLKIAGSAKIASDVQFIFSSPAQITIGDYCVIGPGVKFICSGGNVNIGDWTTLHDRCLILSKSEVKIGEHCWFGQNSIIDGTGGITIGRGVRVGMYSQLWSHVAAGEQIEGCTLIGEKPVVIEDDVWLVGSCIVASGVTIGRRSVALIGSNITKSCFSNTVLAGTPAISKPNINFYRNLSLDQKWLMLEEWLREIAKNINAIFDKCDIDENISLKQDTNLVNGLIIFVKSKLSADLVRRNYPDATVCCVEDKTYNKLLTTIEYQVLKLLAGNKARFNSI